MAYRITMKGADIGGGEAFVGQYLAINPGMVSGPLPGTPTQDPAFGLPAVWIEPALREQAQAAGYTVVDASTAVATHLNHLITSHAGELLGRQEVQQLLDHIQSEAPKLVEDFVPKTIPLFVLQNVLRNLLFEGVHIRDMRTIIESITEHAAQTQDANELTVWVRIALGRSIVQQLFPAGDDLSVMALDTHLERLLMSALHASRPGGAGIEPELADTIVRQTEEATRKQEQLGLPAVLLVPQALRMLLARFLTRAIPQIKVLSHDEIPDSKTVRIGCLVGGVS